MGVVLCYAMLACVVFALCMLCKISLTSCGERCCGCGGGLVPTVSEASVL